VRVRLLEVNGEDVRAEPIEDRKRRLAGLLRLSHQGIALNETYREDGTMISKHATVQNRPIGLLAQDQEPGCAGGEARSRRRLELIAWPGKTC
jgi:hypothetical protein